MTEPTPEFQWTPPPRQAAVFTGYTSNPDSLDEWANSLSIETGEGSDPNDQYATVALVLVDTNYKPSRTGQHPVWLTRVDAIRAAAALLGTVLEGYDDQAVTPDAAAELLRTLQEVDSTVYDLREQLLIDLTPDEEEQAADEPEEPGEGGDGGE